MQKRSGLFAIALSTLIFAPVTALALPSCLDLRDNPAYGLAGHAEVLNLTASLTTTGANARCEINFIYSSRGGPESGYDEGERQRVAIRVGLPRNSSDGGAGGIEGAWNGRTRALGGGDRRDLLRSRAGAQLLGRLLDRRSPGLRARSEISRRARRLARRGSG